MAAKRLNPISLTDEQIESIYADALDGKHSFETAKRLGFTSKPAYWFFLRKNEQIKKELEVARFDSCMFIEDDLLNLHEICPDAKMARVRMEILCRILAFRNPSKYSQRIDVNMNQNVSVRIALDGANDRMLQFMKDVTLIQAPVSTP